MLKALLIPFLLLSSSALIAGEQVLACRSHVESDRLPFVEADQVAFDVARQTVDLRVASTIGTSKPKNWKFQNRAAPFVDSFTVKQSDEAIFGGGTHGAAAHAFELYDGVLTWTMVLLGQNWTMRWSCQQ